MNNPLIVPVFIPHMGCKHQCVFCNQRKITGSETLPDTAKIKEQVLYYQKNGKNIEKRSLQIAFYGGSFTGLAENMQEIYLSFAHEMKSQGLIQAIRLSTRPDYIDKAVLDRLERYEVDIVELGVQSMDEDVLKQSGRGHTAQQVVTAAKALQDKGFTVGLQMMIALPGDTPQKTQQTAERIIALRPDFVRIYPTAVIRNTPLADMWRAGKYEPWDWDVLLDATAEAVQLFERARIPIIRIGLQAADNLTLQQDLLAGGYHPALGELVKSRVMRQKIEERLLRATGSKKSYDLYCADTEISQVIGQKKCNLIYFEQKYGARIHVIGQKRAKGTFDLQEVSSPKGETACT